jgi:hypothetical protein
MITPYDWQLPIIRQQTEQLRKGHVFVCSATTGAGKTVMALQTVKELGLPALVVCPKVARTQWLRTAEAMAVPKELILDVTNPEQISKPRAGRWYSRDEGWTGVPGNALLIWDEIHRVSGPKSQATKAIARFGNKAHPDTKLLAMTATLGESPEKLRALGWWFGWHRFLDAPWYDWLRRHGCGYVDIGWGARKRRVFKFTTNRKRATEIMQGIRLDMGERFISVGPGEIPGFPEEVKEVMLIDLEKVDHDELVRAYEEMPPKMQDMSQDDMVKMLRLRQQAEFCKAEVMAQMACDLIEDGNSVFVMVNFTDARKRIEAYLDRKGLKYASIYGGQKEAERQAGIEAFQHNDVFVMVGMAAACSVALSLHDERHERARVSLISPGYSASEFSQGLGRIRRVGGTAATQKIVVAADSVEEKVGMAIERKMASLEALTDKDLMR